MDSMGSDRGTHVKVSNHRVQDVADSLGEGVGTDAIIIDFSKAFDLIPHDQLLTKLEASGVNSRVVLRVREFLVGRT